MEHKESKSCSNQNQGRQEDRLHASGEKNKAHDRKQEKNRACKAESVHAGDPIISYWKLLLRQRFRFLMI